MHWLLDLLRRVKSRILSSVDVPLPILVHSHNKDALPPGPLEEGFVAIEQDGVVLHALVGVLQPDGTIGDVPKTKLEWARRISYRHLQREGCLAQYSIPRIPAYETDEALDHTGVA